MRRLPVYLLLDCSGSMAGEPVMAMRMALRTLLSDLRTDPMAGESAWISLITYDSVAQQIVPLGELAQFRIPDLPTGGLSSVGEAFRLAASLLDWETRTGAANAWDNDWKPVIFLVTDGNPTDNWSSAMDELRRRNPADIIVCGAGPHAHTSVLKDLGTTVLHLEDLQPGMLRDCLKWEAR